MQSPPSRMSRRQHWFLPAALLVVLAACKRSDPYATEVRSDEQLEVHMRAACHAARGAGRPMLVEFSAPWCDDCKQLHRMKQRGELAQELARWSVEVVNIGEFDRHENLLNAFSVTAIATWVVVPTDACDKPMLQWKALSQRVVEPASGTASEQELTGWLRSARAN